MTRRFYSPPLDPGKTYTYTVNAAWYEDGQLQTQRQQVDVRADTIAQVNFTQDSQMAGRETRGTRVESDRQPPPPPRETERTAAKPDTEARGRDESLPPPASDRPRDEPRGDEPPKGEPPAEPKIQGEKEAPPIDGPRAEPARDGEPEEADSPRS